MHNPARENSNTKEAAGRFVFEKKYLETIRKCDKEEQASLLFELVECALYGRESENPLVDMMLWVINGGAEDPDEAADDSEKTGRPARYVEPEIWQSYYENHTREETAAFFGISVDTLKKWIHRTGYRKGEGNGGVSAGKSLNNIYPDTVTDKPLPVSGNKNKKIPAQQAAPLMPPACTGYKPKEGETALGDPHFDPVTQTWLQTVREAGGRRVERIAD